MKKSIFFLLLVFCSNLYSNTTEINLLEGEYWWGGAVALGDKMPYIQPLSSYNI